MGEVAEKGTMQTEEEHSNYEQQQKDEDGSSEVMFRWDKFLPRVVLRVLLVEADDSTRQIIAALLRKCSYSVAAVSDGLKAWETLKIKASDIDLILTEVELPSISGFSLLTLIMEHDIYKSIPVIMMSSHDSVSMVFKCMLKGAADFLIKPVRRNELRNLWQHVWRRHAISKSPQNLTFAQKILEATSENNATNNNSSGSVASTQKNNEFTEKTSEAQSTCTSPFLEAESASMENMQDTCQLKSSSNLSNIVTMKHVKSTKFEMESAKYNNESQDKSITFVSEAARCNKTFKSTDFALEQGYHFTETENHDGVLRAELSKANVNINAEIHGCCNGMVEHSGGAIDLIATFDNLPKNSDKNCSFNGDSPAKFDFDTHLELSLRRDLPGSSCKQATGESQTLNHSNASAFSWYSGSRLQPLFPTPSNDSAKLTNTNWNSHESCKLSETIKTVDNSHQYGGKSQNQENIPTLVIGQSGQVEPKLPNIQLGFFPTTTVNSDHKSGGHGNVFPFMFYSQSGVHPIWTPKPFCEEESSPFPSSTSSQSNPETNHSEKRHSWSDDATFSSDQNVDKSTLNCARQSSPAAGESAGTSLSHDAANHINSVSSAYGSIGSRSDANGTSAVTAKNNPESSNDDGFRGTGFHHSSQREAALTKFRLKRKERCYEKKVRYQSRKRLAEQRPRVKGQFVRQVSNEHTVADASGGS